MCLKSGHLLCTLSLLCTGWEPVHLSISSSCLGFLIPELLRYTLTGWDEMSAHMGIAWYGAWCSVNNTHQSEGRNRCVGGCTNGCLVQVGTSLRTALAASHPRGGPVTG